MVSLTLGILCPPGFDVQAWFTKTRNPSAGACESCGSNHRITARIMQVLTFLSPPRFQPKYKLPMLKFSRKRQRSVCAPCSHPQFSYCSWWTSSCSNVPFNPSFLKRHSNEFGRSPIKTKKQITILRLGWHHFRCINIIISQKLFDKSHSFIQL